MNVPESLTYKIGPLPAWVWGVGIGGGILVVMKVRASRSPPVAVDVNAGDAGPPALDDDAFNMAASPLGGGGTWAVTPSTQPDAVTTPTTGRNVYTTNNAWRRAAVDWLIAQDYDSLTADTALTKYLDGSEVTAAEAGAVRAVLRDFGLPPEGAPSIRIAAALPPATLAPAAPEPAPAAPAPAAPAPAAAAPVPEGTYTRRGVLGHHMVGPDVARLQNWLRVNTTANISDPSGTFGDSTWDAVHNFQAFLSGGADKIQGTDGVIDGHWWGVIDYVSSRGGYASVT